MTAALIDSHLCLFDFIFTLCVFVLIIPQVNKVKPQKVSPLMSEQIELEKEVHQLLKSALKQTKQVCVWGGGK